MDPATRQHEYDAIKSGAGIRLLEDRLLVRVSGDDSISFMHGMCSADIKSLEPGRLARALFLTERAHVIADCYIYALHDQALWLEVERARWAVIRENLERFLVADDVELEELESCGLLDIEGPRSPAAMAEFAGEAVRELAPWQHLERDGVWIARLPRYGEPAFTLIAEHTRLAAVAAQIQRSSPEICELHRPTLEIIRIENGLALIGLDTNERTLALEARLESAIAFNKGCYVGQETIERATAHGSLKRRLYGLQIAADEIPSPGALIQLEGKEVGRLTSVARSPAAGVIGLGILHHSAWAAGTRVSIVDGKGVHSGSVCDLPFRPSPAAASRV